MKIKEKLAERKELKELKDRIAKLERQNYALNERIKEIVECVNFIEKFIPNAKRQSQEAIEEYLKQNVVITFQRMEENLIRAELKKRMLDNIFGEKNEQRDKV